MLTPLYQEGETVRIKDYDEIYKSYTVDGRVRIYPAWVSDMKQFCGKEVVVTEVCKDAGRGVAFYRFGRAGGGWAWAEYLLEPLHNDIPIEITMSLDELV